MRHVTTNDADELAVLETLLFPENCFNETTLANEISIGGGWVVEQNGQLVAYALTRQDDYVVDVIRLGVHPDYQNLGFGTELLRQAMGLGRTVMLSVKADNQGALRLYHRLGFELVGRLRDGAGWVMRLRATLSAS